MRILWIFHVLFTHEVLTSSHCDSKFLDTTDFAQSSRCRSFLDPRGRVMRWSEHGVDVSRSWHKSGQWSRLV